MKSLKPLPYSFAKDSSSFFKVSGILTETVTFFTFAL